MSPRRFQRKIESFVCEQCSESVTGNGFTNHCPKCLWSKHVDIFPGDRAESCNGLMAPVEVHEERGRYRLLHRCLKCGVEKVNRSAEEDSFEAMLRIVSAVALDSNV